MTKITQKNASSAAPEQIAGTDERRHGTRIPFRNVIATAFPYAAQCQLSFVVENISFGGVALRVMDVSRLAVGEQLDILILKHTIAIVIKYIVKLQEGGYRVGAEFVAPDLRDVRAVVEELLAP